MIESIITLLNTGLTLWATEEANKYLNEVISLKEAYTRESNKPRAEQSDDTLDTIRIRLLDIASGFASGVAKSNPSNKP